MFSLTVRRIAAALLLVVVLGIVALWLARKPIADDVIRRTLSARGVVASYTVKSIGLRWERIENVRVGDPRSPDLTAEWAEIRVVAGLGGIVVKAVRAGGVRVHGRLIDGRLSLGAVDKLLPETDGKTPFRLPDLDVDFTDARVRIDSLYGPLAARIDGRGNLADGFAGKVAAIVPGLALSGCAIARATAFVDVHIRNRAPSLRGPVRADSARCGAVAIAQPAVALDVTLNAAFDRWRGKAVVEALGLQHPSLALAALDGQIAFDGGMNDTRGTGGISARAGRSGNTGMAGLTVKGVVTTARGLRAEGRVTMARLIPDRAVSDRLDSLVRSTAATPVGPLLARLATAVRGAAGGVAVEAEAIVAGGTVTIIRLGATSANGAVLRAQGGSGLRFGAAGFYGDTRIGLSGGGFPDVQSTLQRRADGVTVGLAQIAPYGDERSRIALDPVRFAVNPAGAVRIETLALLDGPLPGGGVVGLRLPVNATVAANGNMIVNNGCTTLGFRILAISGLTLDAVSMRLCPVSGGALFRLANGRVRGGATIAAARLTGRLGETPLVLAAGKATVTLETTGFALGALSAQLGRADRVSQLAIGTLSGRWANGALQGRFAGASGNIGKVPLRVDNGSGDWTLRNGALRLGGTIIVSDEAVPARFSPLITDDAALRLVGGRIDATATLKAPASGAEVTKVIITHDLGSGTGNAALMVPSLRFGKNLQPEALTRLTLGVVANVDGTISGRGDIHWNPSDVTSTGRFVTEGLDFAAAFGPVTGLKGAIVFDDLLALATPPGQRVTIDSINPGTLVTNGVIAYRLVPGQRIAIERGIWPFAGGDLLLDPTTIDMGQDRERKLTFRVVGLDAAKFIQQLEFENLAATGIFDGIMPMYFDANGGRIEGGRLVVRAGGGTLAYVGEVSNADMNIYAKIAFDALKSIRYNNLTIALNGPLDGEIVSQINFDGINEAPLTPPKSFIARQFIGLPFVFNIKVTAPFRSLLNTARTFQDPSSLLQRKLPQMSTPPVQPAESDTRP